MLDGKMTEETTETLVREIMLDFARRTGLDPVDPHPRRYLWTDAFAVCNYLELFCRCKDEAHKKLALRLVDQVHHTLGRHRDDDPRSGWISGLEEQEGEHHPTMRGLRIGKQLKERKAHGPPNERLEWDRDGQYYHYLTKWMHALNCAGQVAGDLAYIRWAVELAQAAHARFTYMPASGGGKRMCWKMSIDLSYPLVASMGQHDPLDGLVTYCELIAAATRDFEGAKIPDLKSQIAEMAEICQGLFLATDDPLGIGGLLFDASRVAQLMMMGRISSSSLLETVLDSALAGLRAFGRSRALDHPARFRLAFRELGLSIGLAAVEKLAEAMEENRSSFGPERALQGRIEELMEFVPLRKEIEQFWMDDENREGSTWIEHQEINMVMLATSLAPGRFLTI
jgi:hypothetical protein